MGRRLKRFNFFIRRRSHLSVMIVCAGVVLLLFFNEETSLTRAREYDSQISELKQQIRTARDSAEYYRNARRALLSNPEELEQVARENYNMQRPTEDVYVIEEGEK